MYALITLWTLLYTYMIWFSILWKYIYFFDRHHIQDENIESNKYKFVNF